MTEEEARTKAARIAARAELLDIRGNRVNADAIRHREPNRRLTFTLEHEVTVQWDDEEEHPDSLVVDAFFDLRLRMLPEEKDAPHAPVEEVEPEQDPDLLAVVQFGMQSLFHLHMRHDDGPVNQDELQAFAITTGLFAMYPFAREWAHDLTGRLGLPPLTLPTMTLPHDGPGTQAVVGRNL